MQLDEIAAAFTVDPEKEKLFAKQVCSSLHGKVRFGAGHLLLTCIKVLLLIAILYWLTSDSGILLMLTMVPAVVGGIFWLWYQMSWELAFDGETGFMSFRTLLDGMIRFHVSEIGLIGQDTLIFDKSLWHKDVLFLTVGEKKIVVELSRYLLKMGEIRIGTVGGHTNAEKLQQYLDLYQKFLAAPDFGLQPDISPAVAAAIAAQKKEAAETVRKATPDEEIQERTEPHFEPDTAAPTSKMPSRKSDMDVNALFDSVLREYGKKK